MTDQIHEHTVLLDSNVIVRHNIWDCFADTLELEYIERSPDSWYSDNEVSIDIDKKQAIELIALLQRFVERV